MTVRHGTFGLLLLAALSSGACGKPQASSPMPDMPSPPPAQSGRWRTVSVANNVRLSLDTVTLRHPSDERAIVWTREDYLGSGRDLRARIALLEINCTGAAYRELKVLLFGRMGEMYGSTESPSAEWIHLPPVSIYEELINVACQ